MQTSIPEGVVRHPDGTLTLPDDGDPACIGKNLKGRVTQVIGCDLALQRDRTAAVVFERCIYPYWLNGYTKALSDPVTTILGASFVSGADYMEIMTKLMNLMRSDELRGAKLFMDIGASGRALHDAIKAHPRYKETGGVIGVQITGGSETTQTNRLTHWNVSRSKLYLDLGVAMQNGDIQVADFPERQTLLNEISGLSLRYSPSGQKRVEDAGSTKKGVSHADMASAAALGFFGCQPQFHARAGVTQVEGMM